MVGRWAILTTNSYQHTIFSSCDLPETMGQNRGTAKKWYVNEAKPFILEFI